jgi:hypothetical protein
VADRLELFFVRDYYLNEFSLVNYFNYSELPLLGGLTGITFLAVLVFSLLFTKHKLINQTKFSFKNSHLIHPLVSCLLSIPLFVGLILIGNGWFIFLAFMLLPLLVLVCSISANENINFFKSISQTGGMLNKSWSKFIGLSLIFFLISWLFFIAFSSALNTFIIKDGLIWSLTNDQEVATTISIAISAFLISFSFLVYLILMASSFSVLYYTLKETYTAENLISRISLIKSKA